MKKKYEFVISEGKIMKRLRKQMELTGKDAPEVLRSALAFYFYASDRVLEGKEIAVVTSTEDTDHLLIIEGINGK